MKNTLHTVLYCCVVAAFGQANAADPAEPSKDAAAAAQSDKVETVIVTATKRKERAQDVPISVTALGERALDARGIGKAEDYLAAIPGVALLKDYSGQPSFAVRGVTTGAGPQTTAAPAGVYIDDYPVYDSWWRFNSTDMRIFDVERIEVLRGPQGTLFGASSLSGAMKYITNKPDPRTFDAKVEITGAKINGGGNDFALNAMVNQPLSESTALRVVAYDRKDGGWIDNFRRGASDVNTGRSTGGRIALSHAVTPRLNVLGTLMYQKTAADDGPYTYYFPPAGRTITDWGTFYPYGQNSDKLQVASLNATYDLDWATLTMYGLHAKDDSEVFVDAWFYAQVLGGVKDVPTRAAASLTHSKSGTYEARLESKGGGPLKYTLGVYHSNRKRGVNQSYLQPAVIATKGTDNLYTTRVDTETDEVALFGEATYQFAEKWFATMGLRAGKNDFHLTANLTGLISGGKTPLVPALSDTQNNETSYTPKYSLSYQPDSATNIYTTVSKGYRYGLANYYNGATLNTFPLNYKPDSLWNYELGLKKSMLDGKLVSNSALYYIDWKDIQFGFRNAQNTLYTTNAGRARIYGVEEELSYKPTRAWELNLTFALSNQEMAEDSPRVARRTGSARGPAVLGIMKGDRLPGSPEANLSAGVQYNIGEVMGGRAHVRLDATYVGSSYYDFMQEGSLKMGGYTTANLRLGYLKGIYDWTLFANNLFNNQSVTNYVPNYDLLGADAAIRNRPRTIGVTLRMHY